MKLDRKKVYLQMIKKNFTSQKQLAKKAGVGESTLVICLNGKNVGLSTLLKLCNCLKCEPEELCEM